MYKHDTVCSFIVQGYFKYPPNKLPQIEIVLMCLLIKSGRSTILHKVMYLWNNVCGYYRD